MYDLEFNFFKKEIDIDPYQPYLSEKFKLIFYSNEGRLKIILDPTQKELLLEKIKKL